MFSRAIVRPPSANFGAGLTTVNLGKPDYSRALEQHEAYCAALEQCGLALTRVEADPRYADSTFVEDVAVLTTDCAIVMRPGAPSRAGEVVGVREVLEQFYPSLKSIDEPGTVDGGDVCEVVCEVGKHFFIGISERTNADGAEQLAALLATCGYTSTLVNVREVKEILHLKSGLAYLGDGRLALIGALADRREFRDYDLVRVDAGEEYAANCVCVNDYVLVVAGYEAFERKLQILGYQTLALDMTEFQKMDGGLSCLSLRF